MLTQTTNLVSIGGKPCSKIIIDYTSWKSYFRFSSEKEPDSGI